MSKSKKEYDKRVTAVELAKHFEVDESTFRAWVRNGHVPYYLDEKSNRRYYHRNETIKAVEKFLKDRAENTKNKIKKIDSNNKTTANMNKSKAVREEYNAKLAKLKYETTLQELVKVEVVEKRLFELSLQVRDALLNIPNKVSAELASMVDEKKINIFLDNILREALDSISEGELEKWTEKKLK